MIHVTIVIYRNFLWGAYPRLALLREVWSKFLFISLVTSPQTCAGWDIFEGLNSVSFCCLERIKLFRAESIWNSSKSGPRYLILWDLHVKQIQPLHACINLLYDFYCHKFMSAIYKLKPTMNPVLLVQMGLVACSFNVVHWDHTENYTWCT